MEKLYFIVRVKTWCAGFYYGTREELKTALDKIGAEIIGTEGCVFERIGLQFDERIKTMTPVFGLDKEAYNEVFERLEKVLDEFDIPITRDKLKDIHDLRYAIRYGLQRDINTDDLDILVSDGEFHPKPNCGYIGVYDSYKPLSEFDDEWIWHEFADLCGYGKPEV